MQNLTIRKTVRAFTLIELLVVVAIIALLISILLPALSEAKEQGRVSVCMSNLRTMSQALNVYFNDGQEDMVFSFPFDYYINGTPQNFGLISEVIWGGGIPQKSAAEWAGSGMPNQMQGINPASLRTDAYIVRPKDRPLNKYLSSSVSWDDPERVYPNARRQTRPMDLPGFFKCPSDRTALLPVAGFPSSDRDGDTPYSTWEWWGNSYPSNWYWPYYYVQAPPGFPGQPYQGSFNLILAGRGNPPLRSLGRHMLKDKGGRWGSEFIVFYENRLNYAMNNSRPRGFSAPNAYNNFTGWHRKKDRHIAAFMDGGARYMNMDTRFVDGPGWTTWPTKPWAGSWTNYNDR